MAKLAFIQNLSYEYLGTMYLSSLLRKDGHSVEVFIENGARISRLAKDVSDFGPDVVGFYCSTGMRQWVLNMASAAPILP